MTDTGSISMIDYDGERSSIQINTVELSSANFDATDVLLENLRGSTLNITLGIAQSRQLNAKSIISSIVLPTDPSAQRENKWLVTCEDISEFLDSPADTVPNPSYRKIFTYEIPTADLGLLDNNSGVVFPKTVPNAAISAWIADWEAVAKSPNAGDLAVRKMEFVGRNL